MLKELIQFLFNFFFFKKGIENNPDFRNHYDKLNSESYEKHLNYNLEPGTILEDGLPSDCEDRANDLALKALTLGYSPFMLVLLWEDSGHMATYIDLKVYDPTHGVYGEALDKYLKNEKPVHWYVYPYAGRGL